MSPWFGSRHDRGRKGGRDPRQLAAIAAAGVAVEAAALWLTAGRLGGNVVVRCRQDHLFTTIWIPGASVKAVRLLSRRFQRCPVGGHWSLVTPVRESDLTEAERSQAHEQRDIRLP